MAKRKRKPVRVLAVMVGGLKPNECRRAKGTVRVCNRGGKLVMSPMRVSKAKKRKSRKGGAMFASGPLKKTNTIIRMRTKKGVRCVRVAFNSAGKFVSLWTKNEACKGKGKVYTWKQASHAFSK